MPRSTNYFKKETKEYIVNKYKKNIRILDIGAGLGTYSMLLKPAGFNNIDCVEVFEEYVNGYKLKEKYKNVYLGDITKIDIDFNQYDLIILGDVFEHIDKDDSRILLDKLRDKNVIVAIPFESKQEEFFGNIHEIHIQDDLTLMNFIERNPEFYPLCLRFDYGVFVKESIDKIFIEDEEQPMSEEYQNYINENFINYDLISINSNNQKPKKEVSKSKITIVTALYNLGRDNINQDFKRSYSDYLKKFKELLDTDINMYIFIDPSDESFVWKHRVKENTVVNLMTLDELKKWFNFTNKTNEIRQDKDWLSQSDWLPKSPQATLEGYNPLVMSKMFMLNNVTIFNPFNSEYFFWIDAGLTSTVSYGYFTHDKVLNNLPEFIEKNNSGFVFLTYPYVGGNEIHGFERKAIAKYCNTDYVNYVCRGGFFGGKKPDINEINGLYYSYLNSSLNDGLMGTEESIFTIISHTNPDTITRFMLEDNGLVYPFFEDLKNKNYSERVVNKISKKSIDNSNVGLYVLSFNSPKQFENLCLSFERYDGNFLSKPTKYILNNSTDRTTDEDYKLLCEKYGFIEIKKDNIGICGGRQFIAEHAEENKFDYYFFFEDDMFFYLGHDMYCKNGFKRKINNFYDTMMKITWTENFDFLKWNFTEFFGDNTKQWAWHNVPAQIRKELFPENPVKTNDNVNAAPFMKFKNIKSLNGLPYASGEIYYCNWPQTVSRDGNRKMFLTTKWTFPYEQTWMSHIYQETLKGNINPGILLATPTEHNRFDFYPGEERREN